MALDRTDVALLELLQNDARMTNKELAARVGLAPSSCFERVRRLIEEGYIRGFHAEVDPKKVGVGLQAMFLVRLETQSRSSVQHVHDAIMGLPEVLAIYLMTGSVDLLVHVAVRDTEHLRELAFEALTRREEVAKIETALVFDYDRRAEMPIYGVEE